MKIINSILLFFSFNATYCQTSLNTSIVGHWGTEACYSIQATDSIVFYGQGDTLKIVDISSIENPIPLGKIAISTNSIILDIEIVGNYAYVANNSNGFRIINISNLSNPYEEGYLQFDARVLNINIKDSYAYIANNSDGLRIVDISDPSNPVEVGAYEYYFYFNGTQDVVVKDDYAFIGLGDGMRILDISDPTSPIHISTIYISVGVKNIAIKDNHVYASVLQYCNIIDVSNINNPHIESSIHVGYSSEGLMINDSILFIAGNDFGGLVIADISDPSTPVIIGNTDIPGRAKNVAINENYAFIASSFGGVRIVDISDLTNPEISGKIDIGFYPQGVKIVDSHMYVADDTAGLKIIDISDRTNPVEISHLGTPFNNNMSHGPEGYKQLIQIENNIVYITMQTTGLRIIDVSDPYSPIHISSYDASVVLNLEVQDNIVFLSKVANNTTDIVLLDVTNIETPTEISTINISGVLYGMEIVNEYLFCSEWYSGFSIYNISDISNPIQISHYDMPDAGLQDIAVHNDYLYLAEGGASIHIFDVSNPNFPMEISTYHTSEYIMGINALEVKDNYAYLATYKKLIILDISDPYNPVEVGYFNPYKASVRDVIVGDSLVYLTSGDNGVYTIRNEHQLAIDTNSEGSLPDKFILHQSYPNPFNGYTVLSYSLPQESDVLLNIYDLQGRLIKTVTQGYRNAGRFKISWNGTNSQGQSVSSGVYLVQLQTESHVAKRKVVYLK
ncbi:MAG: T9SS type A sorting domain-containing protein [Candidatus Marinimicrobia bacterium]|nr:T9SS type A sorting domain-containing protein [Candidatus Neomarinimicrobiota bacterium]